MTYRNSCLAVLVGDVGKSSSLQMKIQEKAGKQKGSKYDVSGTRDAGN